MNGGYQLLKEWFRDRPYLVANAKAPHGKRAAIVGEREALQRMTDAPWNHSQVVMNVGHAVEQFASAVVGRDERTFTQRECATIAGMDYHAFYQWVNRDKLIRPSVRRGQFNWTDAFIAGVCGSLRRQGMPIQVLKEVVPLFVQRREEPKKKRTKQTAATAARS